LEFFFPFGPVTADLGATGFRPFLTPSWESRVLISNHIKFKRNDKKYYMEIKSALGVLVSSSVDLGSRIP
jgi:hypothetical protein